jgi:hypothetical protein
VSVMSCLLRQSVMAGQMDGRRAAGAAAAAPFAAER